MAETTYTYTLADFPNGKVASDRLSLEIRQSTIVIALERIDTSGNDVAITFKDALSVPDKTTLDGLVATHSGEPLPGGNYSPDGDPIQAVARGIGAFVPDPRTSYLAPQTGQGSVDSVDYEGAKFIRGPVLTDEGSFRDDFPGASLVVTGTGDATFENSRKLAFGVGTDFFGELHRDYYVRRSVDGSSDWVTVERVESGTAMVLSEPYPGTTGTGPFQRTLWVEQFVGGGATSVAASELTLDPGALAGASVCVQRFGDYGPMTFWAALRLTGRDAEQVFRVGLLDDPEAPIAQAVVEFSGADDTKVLFRTSNHAGTAKETLVTIPNAGTTATDHEYDLQVTPRQARLYIDGTLVATHRRHVPDPYADLSLVLDGRNLNAPASPAVLVVDEVFFANMNVLETAAHFG